VADLRVDLLNSSRQISILEDSFGVTQLAGAVEHQVTKLDEILAYIEEAASFRRTEATLKNDTSSRSHAVCRFRISIPTIPDAEDGMLYLIDLAGSEAARDRSAHDTTRMREAREINRSLSVLKDCIRGKAESDALEGVAPAAAKSKKKPYVPFRQSALTKVLKHVFDPASTRGATKTVVVACVNPNILDIVPSRNTLRYAELLRVVLPRGEPVKFHPDVPMTWSNEQLRAWIDKEVSRLSLMMRGSAISEQY
jgi:kinesin family protein 2/24